MIYIFWTCRNKKEAKKIISKLMERRLIACASIFSGVESIYRWEGKVENSREVKVILKTVSERFRSIQKIILAECSCEVPEILQVDISDGNPSYISWVLQETALNDIV